MSGSNTPQDTSALHGGARLDADGNVTHIGQVLRSGADGTVSDVTQGGQQVADRGVDPKTGLAYTPEQIAAQQAALAAETPEQKTARETAEAAALKDTPEDKTSKEADPFAAPEGYVKPAAAAIEAYKAEALKVDPRSVPYAEELITTGTVSAESRAKAAKEFNVPPAMVDNYFAGLMAQRDGGISEASAASAAEEATKISSIHEAVGGATKWTEFAKWANTNLSAEDMETLTEAVNGKSVKVAQSIAKGYYAQYTAAGNGGGPRDLSNGGASIAPAGTDQGFTSRAEQSKAMNDPKYRSDEAYRAIVDRKVQNSRFT